MTTTATINPFYALRLKQVAPLTEERDQPLYARLPRAPKNASPVPHLTIFITSIVPAITVTANGRVIAAAI